MVGSSACNAHRQVIDMNDFHLKVNTSFTHEITVDLYIGFSFSNVTHQLSLGAM